MPGNPKVFTLLGSRLLEASNSQLRDTLSRLITGSLQTAGANLRLPTANQQINSRRLHKPVMQEPSLNRLTPGTPLVGTKVSLLGTPLVVTKVNLLGTRLVRFRVNHLGVIPLAGIQPSPRLLLEVFNSQALVVILLPGDFNSNRMDTTLNLNPTRNLKPTAHSAYARKKSKSASHIKPERPRVL